MTLAKRIISLCIIVMMMFSLAACKENDVINAGFTGSKLMKHKFYCGVKSEKIVFNLADDIELDFYFGHANGYFRSRNNPNPNLHTHSWNVAKGYERVSIAVYFSTFGGIIGEYPDYRNVERLYFIKEFSFEEFHTEQYAATYTSPISFFSTNGRTVFNHHETLTVPKEVLAIHTYDGGTFEFVLVDVWLSEETGNYYVDNTNSSGLGLHYQYINDNQVKIYS